MNRVALLGAFVSMAIGAVAGCSSPSATASPPDAAPAASEASSDAGGVGDGSIENADARDSARASARVAVVEGYEYKNGSWSLIARQEHDYEGDVRVRTRALFAEGNQTWNLASTATYTYEMGRLVATRTKYVNTSLLAEDELRNFYDMSNRITRQEGGYLETASGPWIWDTRVALSYESDGRLVKEEQEHLFASSGKWAPESRITHEYDEKGVQTGFRVYLYAIMRDSERHAFEYDPSGRLDKETVYRLPPGAAEIPEKRFVSIYR